jgi:hypothetical protein
MSNWISVKDCEPSPEDGPVLVLTEGKEYYVASSSSYDLLWYLDVENWSTEVEDVEWWMYLPDAPQKD